MVHTYDYDGSGVEHEIVMSPHTLMLYEQEFKKGLIEDVFGRFSTEGHENDISDDGIVIVRDFTIDNWASYPRVLWAMLRAASDLATVEQRAAERIPSFAEWSMRTSGLSMDELSRVVVERIQHDLFRAGAASAERSAGEAGESE